MTAKTYVALAVGIVAFGIGWLWLGPAVITVTIWIAGSSFFVYLIARLFLAVIHRLER